MLFSRTGVRRNHKLDKGFAAENEINIINWTGNSQNPSPIENLLALANEGCFYLKVSRSLKQLEFTIGRVNQYWEWNPS